MHWRVNQDPPSVDIQATSCQIGCGCGRLRCCKETWTIFRAAKTLKSRSLSTYFQVQFVEKLSVLSAKFTQRFADFEAQKCRFELLSNLFAVDVESAPTNLQMELNELHCCDTLKSNHDSVGAAQFLWFIPTQCPNSVHKLLKCSLCSAAHIYVNSYSLWWRWTKHYTGVISWWTPSLNPEDFLSSEPDPRHWWTSIKEKMPGIWLGQVCIRVNQSVANWAWILSWVFFMHFFLLLQGMDS